MGPLFVLVAIICFAENICWGSFYVVYKNLIGCNSKAALS